MVENRENGGFSGPIRGDTIDKLYFQKALIQFREDSFIYNYLKDSELRRPMLLWKPKVVFSGRS